MLTMHEVKAAVRARDNHCCTKCGMTAAEHRNLYRRTLDVHRLVPGSLYTVEACVTICRRCHKSQPKRKRGQPDLAYPERLPALRIRADLARMIRVLCVAQGKQPIDYLDEILRERVEADFEEFIKQL